MPDETRVPAKFCPNLRFDDLPPAVAPLARRLSGRDPFTAIFPAVDVSGRAGTAAGGRSATPGGFALRVWGISANRSALLRQPPTCWAAIIRSIAPPDCRSGAEPVADDGDLAALTV